MPLHQREYGTSKLALGNGTEFQITDIPAPLALHRRLSVRGHSQVALRFAAPVKSVYLSLEDRHSNQLGREFRAHRRGSSAKRWRMTLPRKLPRRADRVLVAPTFEDASTVGFEFGIRPTTQR